VAAITPGPSHIMLTAAGANAGVLRGLPCLPGVATGMGALVSASAAGTFLSADGGSAIVQSAVLGGLFIVGALLALSIVLIG
jgi:threonine/homoserine/homoserine lactone efflux protein